MAEIRYCDICGRTETILGAEHQNKKPFLQVDEDGLFICNACQKQIRSKPVALEPDSDLCEELQPLIGKSAGAICRTLELPFRPPYQTVIEAASNIAYDQDRYMSAWLFVTQWLDGTTVWRSADGHETVHVTPDGTIIKK